MILINAHKDATRNAGFKFMLYDGSTTAKSVMKAVEFWRGVSREGSDCEIVRLRRLKVKWRKKREVDWRGSSVF